MAKKDFKLNYFDNHYPVSVPAYRELLKPVAEREIPEEIASFLKDEDLFKDFEKKRSLLFSDYSGSPETANYINECLAAANNRHEKMKAVIDELYYYPSFWKDTEAKINYRRFFTINGLICVNIQNKKVFDATHDLIRQWIEQNKINGLRVDHIDGLFNPTEYLNRLREMAGPDSWILVEKILEEDEKLPEQWPIEGSSGYDFLGLVNNLLTNPEKGPVFYSYYNDWIDKSDDFSDVFYKKNRFILYNRLRGELENLTRECLSLDSVSQLKLTEENVKLAIGEFLVFCPVYKVYNSPSKFTEQEKKRVSEIIEAAKEKNNENEKALTALLDLFLLKLPES